MKDLVNETLIELELDTSTKEETIKYLAQLIADDSNRIDSLDEYYQTLLAREEKASTAIGNQIAIPHGKSSSVKEPTVAFARLNKEIKWGADKVQLVFLLAIPEENKAEGHLKILATLSRNLINDSFREKLLATRTKQEANKILTSMFE